MLTWRCTANVASLRLCYRDAVNDRMNNTRRLVSSDRTGSCADSPRHAGARYSDRPHRHERTEYYQPRAVRQHSTLAGPRSTRRADPRNGHTAAPRSGSLVSYQLRGRKGFSLTAILSKFSELGFAGTTAIAGRRVEDEELATALRLGYHQHIAMDFRRSAGAIYMDAGLLGLAADTCPMRLKPGDQLCQQRGKLFLLRKRE